MEGTENSQNVDSQNYPVSCTCELKKYLQAQALPDAMVEVVHQHEPANHHDGDEHDGAHPVAAELRILESEPSGFKRKGERFSFFLLNPDDLRT